MLRGAFVRPVGRLVSAAVGVATIAAAPLQPDRASIAFRVIAQGSDSRIDLHRELIIRGIGVWDFVWRKHATTEPPEIDFRRETVIAIFGGRQAAPARVVHVTSVSEEDGSIVVRYQEDHVPAMPPASSPPASPFLIIAIPPQRSPVKFVRLAESVRH